MKASSRWNMRSIVSTIMIGIVFAAILASAGISNAKGNDGDDRRVKNDRGRFEPKGHARDRNHQDRGREDRTYVYRERVYVPPPVIFAPPPPPGIRIFFPPIFFNL